MTVYIGIDPGKTGGVALIDAKQQARVSYMPESPALLAALLDEWMTDAGQLEVVHAVIENQHAFPGMSAKSLTSIIRNFGNCEGVCSALGFRVHLITTNQWKRELNVPRVKRRKKGDEPISPEERARLRSEAKTKTRQMVQRMWPKLATEFELVKSDGKAEALLMAEYGRRTLGGDDASPPKEIPSE